MNLIPWRNKLRGDDAIIEKSPPGLREEIDRLFDRFLKSSFGSGMPGGTPAEMMPGPSIDLAESEKDITVTAEIPGIDPKDIQIDVTGNILTIRGEKQQETEEKNRSYHYVERRFGSFQRSIQLPTSVDPARIEATAKNGTLTVTLAKHPGAQPKRIEVKGG
jgi:HSP20 family protein